jgi:hypothetical protein
MPLPNELMQRIYYHCSPRSLWTFYLLEVLSLTDLCLALRGSLDRIMSEFNSLPGSKYTSWFHFKNFPRSLHLKEFKELEDLLFHVSQKPLEDIDYKMHLDKWYEYLIIVDDMISSLRLDGELPRCGCIDYYHPRAWSQIQLQVLTSKKILFYNILKINPTVFEFMVMFNALGFCLNKFYNVLASTEINGSYVIKRVDMTKRFAHPFNPVDCSVVFFGDLYDAGLFSVISKYYM